MKLLDLPTEQIEWLIIQLNKVERDAFKRGYLETASLLDEEKNISNLFND